MAWRDGLAAGERSPSAAVAAPVGAIPGASTVASRGPMAERPAAASEQRSRLVWEAHCPRRGAVAAMPAPTQLNLVLVIPRWPGDRRPSARRRVAHVSAPPWQGLPVQPAD